MAHPTSLESAVQQFYQSKDENGQCLQYGLNPAIKVRRQPKRPQTAIEDLAGIQGILQSQILGESIRHDLDIDRAEDTFALFFQDLSGWGSEKASSLRDESSLQYLNCYDKNDEIIDSSNHSSSKKAKSRKALAMREIMTSVKKPSSASTIGYRSKNEWGSEEESRPYALDIPSSQVFQVDEEENMYSESAKESMHYKNSSSRSGSREKKIQDLDQTLNQLIEATATMSVQKSEARKQSRSGRRAVSGCIRPYQHSSTFAFADNRKKDHIEITGKKYHNSDTLPEVSTAGRGIPPPSLPKIHNQSKRQFVATQPPNDKKELVVNINNPERKDHAIEIPKWYADSASLKSSHDQNLVRYMEIMGIKSKLRSPRKLSSNGFQSLSMPNQPPENRGLVFEQKQRGIHSVIEDIIKDESFKVEALSVPNMNSNKRSFAEEVQLNREGKSSGKTNH